MGWSRRFVERVSRYTRLGPLVVVGVVVAAVMALLVWAAVSNGVSIEAAVADPHELTRLRLLGVVSNVGVLLWTVAVATCLVAAVTIDPSGAGKRWRTFFVASGVVTSVLLLDDLFLLHELSDEVVGAFVDFDRTRQQKDILEAAVFTGYAIMFVAYGWSFRQELVTAGEERFLIGSMGMFALSLFIDLGGHERIGLDLPDYRSALDVVSLAEEGPKLIGISYYAGFYLLMARYVLRHTTTSRSPAPPPA